MRRSMMLRVVAVASFLAVAASAPVSSAQAVPPFIVNSTADDANASATGCATAAGTCTLRAAIQAADAAGGGTIDFSIPGSGVQQIAPQSALPPITAPVTIDGYTQPGSSPASGSSPANILISVVGPRRKSYSFTGDGLVLSSSARGSRVRGIQVTNFVGFGIHVQAPKSQISGDRIGSDTFGSSNTSGGIELDGSSGDTIGGPAQGDRNVITSSPFGAGVQDTGGTNNVVEGNYIGPDATGTAAPLPNASGVLLTSTQKDHVLHNVISGNYGDGIQAGHAGATAVQGNFIGIDATGKHPLGNGFIGVAVTDSPNLTLGGRLGADRNIVSASGQQGIDVTGSSNHARIIGNYVGTDATGKAFDSDSGVFASGRVFGNYLQGILIDGSPGAVIGSPGAGNVLNNNGFTVQGVSDLAQITVKGSGATGPSIQSNLLGVTPAGVAVGQPKLGNAQGIVVDGSSDAQVGGPQAGDGNVIAGMQYVGLGLSHVHGGAIQDNLIGTDASGTKAAADNPYEAGVLSLFDSSDIVIGGRRPVRGTRSPCAAGARCSSAMRELGPGNVASAARDYGAPSGAFGIDISGGTDNRLQGDLVGTDVSGEHALGNGTCGVVITDASETRIGGSAPGEGNVISANGLHGIQLGGGKGHTTGTVIEGNRIGIDLRGSSALGNSAGGIALLSGTSDTTIGGSAPGEGNVVSGGHGGNSESNVEVGAPGSGAGSVTNTVIEGNRIGTNAAGTRAVANRSGGIAIQDGASGVAIGGIHPGDGNLISGNRGDGIRLHGAAPGVQILGNLIGTDASGTRPLGNGFDGIGAGSAASNIVIGGPRPGEANVLAYNGIDGVYVDGAQRLRIRGDSIFANHHLGIELAKGGNASQAAPVLIRATDSAAKIMVAGALSAKPNQRYVIDFYLNPPSSGGHSAQGKTWIGSLVVSTGANGLASFRYEDPGSRFGHATNGLITATATDAAGDTSVFSAPLNSCPHVFRRGFDVGLRKGLARGYRQGFRKGRSAARRSSARAAGASLGRGGEAAGSSCLSTFANGFNPGFKVGFNDGFKLGFGAGLRAG